MRLVLFEPDIPQNCGALRRFGSGLGFAVDIIEPCGFRFDERRMRRAGMDYLDRVIGAISRNWTRPIVGSEVKDAIFHFRIGRDRTLTSLTLRQSSGSEVFDDAARRAIASSSPLPPLPRGYKPTSLGINLIVK